MFFHVSVLAQSWRLYVWSFHVLTCLVSWLFLCLDTCVLMSLFRNSVSTPSLLSIDYVVVHSDYKNVQQNSHIFPGETFLGTFGGPTHPNITTKLVPRSQRFSWKAPVKMRLALKICSKQSVHAEINIYKYLVTCITCLGSIIIRAVN